MNDQKATGIDVTIIGGGLAGLACATHLTDAGIPFRLLEASDRLGGRVKTDQVDGFLLDRGFQVFLTAYPEALDLLDYESLELNAFEPGALVRCDGSLQRLSDPWRRPSSLLATAFSSAATFQDKLRIAKFRKKATQGSLPELFDRSESKTIEHLTNAGFSEKIIERFFRPFLGGVFLETELETSSRFCDFVFRMFSTGEATLPAKGMHAIPQQLANRLAAHSVVMNSPVRHVTSGLVELESGEQIHSEIVIVATEAPAAANILGRPFNVAHHSVKCFYFAADDAPIKEPILVLNGTQSGPVNNLCVPNLVSPGYAPENKHLVSVTSLVEGELPEIESEVRSQLQDWFGDDVHRWESLPSYDIQYALPDQSPPTNFTENTPQVESGVFVCGDHCDTASINGAFASGKRVAQQVIAQMQNKRSVGSQ